MKSGLRIIVLLLALLQIALAFGMVFQSAAYALTDLGEASSTLSLADRTQGTALYAQHQITRLPEASVFDRAGQADRQPVTIFADKNSGRTEYTPEDFLIRFRYYLAVLLVVVLFLCVLIVYTMELRRKHDAVIRKNEQLLRNITNNINGGVLVLLPAKHYHVLFVNEGFQKLIQIPQDALMGALAPELRQMIHPGDYEAVSKAVSAAKQANSDARNFSIQFRLRQATGNFLPVLINGTFVFDGKGEEMLYCIIMDFSREQTISERLELEQERYRILIDKSDEILYDVDFQNQTLSVSKKFEEKFGWNWPERYWGTELPDMMHIFEDDRGDFAQMLRAINKDIVDGEWILRVYDSARILHWCKVLFHVMIKNEKRVRLFGKLTVIDDEMNEKQRLLHRAQIDAMTGLYNKEAFKLGCKQYFETNADVSCALIFFDIDNFKEVNDRLGHTVGDEALKDVATTLNKIFTKDDILGRFGGDEFCVLAKNVDELKLVLLLNRMVLELRREYKSDKRSVSVSASIGAACSNEYGSDVDKLLELADKALYYAKENGKNGHVIYYDGLCLKGYTGR